MKGGEKPAELRRLKRRLDGLEVLAGVLDSQSRAQGLRIELYLAECEPTSVTKTPANESRWIV